MKIKVYASTSVSGSKVEDEFDAPENWNEMSEKEQEQYLNEAAQNHLANCVDFGAYAEEE